MTPEGAHSEEAAPEEAAPVEVGFEVAGQPTSPEWRHRVGVLTFFLVI